MRRMAIETPYRKPNTLQTCARTPDLSLPAARPLSHAAQSSLAMDITYIPMGRGFVYLAVVVDWFSRRVLDWRVSITMDTSFCSEALEEALSQHGKLKIQYRSRKSVPQRSRHRSCSKRKASTSEWMAKTAGPTTSSSSVSGVRSNTNTSTLTHTTWSGEARRKIDPTWNFTTPDARAPAWGTEPRPSILPPSARGTSGRTRDEAGRGNVGLMESENFFPTRP